MSVRYMFRYVATMLMLSAHLVQTLVVDAVLVGTWTTKSRAVLTGPGFYDPIHDRFFEPNRTGISYSFSTTGHYETAYFRAIPNPTTPQCPRAIIQYQHGTYATQKSTDFSLKLSPVSPDGRQLLSDPCIGSSTLTRYSQAENISSYTVSRDAYNGEWRLDMLMWDGTPMAPMWLAVQPPVMLPTAPFESNLRGGNRKLGKRDEIKTNAKLMTWSEMLWPSPKASVMFWAGLTMSGVGGVLCLYF